MPSLRVVLGLCALAVATATGQPASGADATPAWTPEAWAKTDTLELTTDVADEGPYSFPVWLVVLDGSVYVRLGTRAADRVEHSRTAPYVGVTVAGQRFDRVRGEPAPETADRVAAAMGEKYWSDVFIRFFPHPLTLRLAPP